MRFRILKVHIISTGKAWRDCSVSLRRQKLFSFAIVRKEYFAAQCITFICLSSHASFQFPFARYSILQIDYHRNLQSFMKPQASAGNSRPRQSNPRHSFSNSERLSRSNTSETTLRSLTESSALSLSQPSSSGSALLQSEIRPSSYYRPLSLDSNSKTISPFSTNYYSPPSALLQATRSTKVLNGPEAELVVKSGSTDSAAKSSVSLSISGNLSQATITGSCDTGLLLRESNSPTVQQFTKAPSISSTTTSMLLSSDFTMGESAVHHSTTKTHSSNQIITDSTSHISVIQAPQYTTSSWIATALISHTTKMPSYNVSVIPSATQDTNELVYLVAASHTRSIINNDFEQYPTTGNISINNSLSMNPSSRTAKDDFNQHSLSTSVYPQSEMNTTFSTSMRARSWFSSNATNSISKISSIAHSPLLKNLATLTSNKSETAKNSRYSSFPNSRLPTPSTRLNRSETLKHKSSPNPHLSLPDSLMAFEPASSHASKTTADPGPITSLPRPIKFLSGTPIYPLNATLPPHLSYGIMELDDGGICQMGLTCETCVYYRAQSCSCRNSASRWLYGHNRSVATTRLCASLFYSKSLETTQLQTCSTVTVAQVGPPYEPPVECCEKCNIRAAEVQVIFWPDTGASTQSRNLGSYSHGLSLLTQVSIEDQTFASDEQNYISPSVYINYKSIHAMVSCVESKKGYFAWKSTGHAYDTKRPYSSEALSSARCFAPKADNLFDARSYQGELYSGIFNSWEALDYQGLLKSTPAEELVSRYQTCFPHLTTRIPEGLASALYAQPRLSMPGDVTDIDPQWQTWARGTCTPVNLGASDPPYILTRATAMVPNTPASTSTTNAETSDIPTFTVLPAANLASPAQVTKQHSSMYATNSDSDPESTSKTPSVVVVTLPVVDPVTTLDPDDSALIRMGKNPSPVVPNPIYELATAKFVLTIVSSPIPAANAPADPQAPSSETKNAIDTQPVSAFPHQIQPSRTVSAADPNSAPIALVPINPVIGQLEDPSDLQAQISYFIAQPISGGFPQLTVTPISQPLIYGQPAHNFDTSSGGKEAGATDPDGILSNSQLVQSLNGVLQIGTHTLALGSLTTVSGHVVNNHNPSVVVADGKTYNLAPTSISSLGFSIQGTTVTPGGPAVTVGGTAISLDKSSHLYVGAINAALTSPSPAQSLFAVGGQAFTANPTGFTIQATKVTPGGQAITVAGTTISLDKSSHLYIGPSIATLMSPSPTQVTFTVGGQKFTAKPGGFKIGGSTFTPGGLGAVIAGILVSLERDGLLVIGSSTFTLPAPRQTKADEVATAVEPSANSASTTVESTLIRLATGTAPELSASTTSGTTSQGHPSGASRNRGWRGRIMYIVWAVFGIFLVWWI